MFESLVRGLGSSVVEPSVHRFMGAISTLEKTFSSRQCPRSESKTDGKTMLSPVCWLNGLTQRRVGVTVWLSLLPGGLPCKAVKGAHQLSHHPAYVAEDGSWHTGTKQLCTLPFLKAAL